METVFSGASDIREIAFDSVTRGDEYVVSMGVNRMGCLLGLRLHASFFNTHAEPEKQRLDWLRLRRVVRD